MRPRTDRRTIPTRATGTMGIMATHSGPAGETARPPGRLDGSRCSVQAMERGDSAIASASPVQRWLLIEQPGPWGRDALLQSRFDADVAPLLAERAAREDVRVLLIRRPGARLADSGRRGADVGTKTGRGGLRGSVGPAGRELLAPPW